MLSNVLIKCKQYYRNCLCKLGLERRTRSLVFLSVFFSLFKWFKGFLLNHTSSESHQTLHYTAGQFTEHKHEFIYDLHSSFSCFSSILCSPIDFNAFLIPLKCMEFGNQFEVFLLGHASAESRQTSFHSSDPFTRHVHPSVMSRTCLFFFFAQGSNHIHIFLQTSISSFNLTLITLSKFKPLYTWPNSSPFVFSGIS